MTIKMPQQEVVVHLTPTFAPDAKTQIECVEFAIRRIERAQEEALRLEQNAAVPSEARDAAKLRVAIEERDFAIQWGNVREILKRVSR